MTSSNETKHRSGNPLLRFALGRFFIQLNAMMPDVDTVLDAGCGEGYGASEIMKAHPQLNIYGIDYSETAAQRASLISPIGSTLVGDVTCLPFKRKSVDLVISLEVLEHLPDPAQAIREYIEVSSRYVLISVPNEPLFRGLRMLRGDNLRQWGNHPEHVNHWNLLSIQRFLTANGLQVLKASSPPPFIWSMVLCQINN